MSLYDDLQKWTESGVLGFYRSCEVTICCLLDHDNKAHNVFTLFAYESKPCTADGQPVYLTRRNERLGDGMRLIVGQYRIPLDDAKEVCLKLECGINPIDTAFGPLYHSALICIPSTFIPADSIQEVTLNRVLKNNFNGGSMVVEWLGGRNVS